MLRERMIMIISRAAGDGAPGNRSVRELGDEKAKDVPPGPPPDDDDDDDSDEAPETPLDEPPPLPVQDPPEQPDPHPYVVLTNDVIAFMPASRS